MKSENQPERKRVNDLLKGDFVKNAGLLMVGGATTMLLLGSWGALRLGDRLLASLGNLLNPPQPPPSVKVESIVVQQVRDASELTTSVFSMQAVVPTSQSATLGGIVVGTTKLLYIAQGQVQAGVDLSQLTPANVEVMGDEVRVQLPPPRILDSKIDVNRSSVYDYNRGMLGLGPDVAPQLQDLAQEQALKTIVQAACKDGVLQRASDRAKLVVTQLLSTAGYQNVMVEVQPSQACGVEPL